MGELDKKLKSYRAEKGLNQTDMADLIGVSFRTYQEIEKSGDIKKSEVLYKITQLLAQTSASEPEEPYQTKRLKRKNASSSSDVPVFNGSTSLGNITMYNDERKEVIATLPANFFPGCDYAEKASWHRCRFLCVQAW